ncbi:MAG: RlmE family RNA methyltransferase [Proteobacteria bacterium]|nr:RlmE family RNA methyltransferase [Pseudomonadota bacterium]MBU1686833.1 RlmE family RNA methyltransferase [Pseudomonadota bacterium]
MKKVQDHYFKQAKKDGYPARSVYKLEEAQKKYHLLKKGDTVLDLGCSPGSWAMYAAQVVGPSGLVIGVDLQPVKGISVNNGAPLRFLVGNILHQEVFDEILSQTFGVSVLLSDMAPRTTGNKWSDQQQSLNLSRRALEIASTLLKEGGAFYCKVFEGDDFKEFFDQVKPSFLKTKVVKPKSSRSESREVFILGQGFRRPQNEMTSLID